jgi:hypothetical protein
MADMPAPRRSPRRAPRTLVELFRELVRLARDPTLLLWALFVLLNPVYVFSNGLPQPGDVLIFVLVPLALMGWNRRLSGTLMRPLRALLLFTGWVFLVNWTWALVTGNFAFMGKGAFLIFPIYYLYNTLVVLVACVLYQRYGARFLWLTLNCVMLAVLIQVAGTFVIHRTHGGIRSLGFFNNPNQLGFFALVSASMIAIGRRRLGFGAMKAGIGLTACLYLALLSASRAAVGGIVILFALTVLSNPRYVIVAAIAAFALLSVGGPIATALDTTQARMEANRYPQYSFFEERGYDRILAHKEYWFLGAGEGGTHRFAKSTAFGTPEIHSGYGTIFFCYGIVGSLMFLSYLWRVASGAALRSTLILLPMLAYMIAHQGLRTTSVWIFLALFVALKHLERTRATAAAPAPQPSPVPAPRMALTGAA